MKPTKKMLREANKKPKKVKVDETAQRLLREVDDAMARLKSHLRV